MSVKTNVVIGTVFAVAAVGLNVGWYNAVSEWEANKGCVPDKGVGSFLLRVWNADTKGPLLFFYRNSDGCMAGFSKKPKIS